MVESIRLRTVEKSDIPFLHKLFNDKNIMDFWLEEPYFSLEKIENIFKKDAESKRNFIVTNDKDEQIGLVGLYNIDFRHLHAEFAIAFDPLQQGKGLATRASKLLLDYAFLTLNLRKVYLIVLTSNEKAIHIYEKLGFQTEGVLKKHFYVNGKYEDGLMMGIFQDDY